MPAKPSAANNGSSTSGGSFYGDNAVHRRAPRHIEIIRKRGYRVIAPVSFPDDYRRTASRVSAWSDGNPYVGLVPLDGDRAGAFFGRSRTTAELMAAIRSQIDIRRRFYAARAFAFTGMVQCRPVARAVGHADCDSAR